MLPLKYRNNAHHLNMIFIVCSLNIWRVSLNVCLIVAVAKLGLFNLMILYFYYRIVFFGVNVLYWYRGITIISFYNLLKDLNFIFFLVPSVLSKTLWEVSVSVRSLITALPLSKVIKLRLLQRVPLRDSHGYIMVAVCQEAGVLIPTDCWNSTRSSKFLSSCPTTHFVFVF